MKYTISLLITLIITFTAFIIYFVRKKRKDQRPHQVARSGKRINLVLFLLIMALGIGVRIYRFGRVPAGLFVDEAAIGYNTYALVKYGIDMNGFHNPVNFVTFGSGQHALYAYLSMPFITLLGLNPVSTRLVSLLLGILSLVVLYFLIRRIDNERTALVGMFFLAISPWHVMMSRWGLDCNPFPAVFLLATWLLVLSFKRQWLFMPSMLVYGLTFYAYGTAYFTVPVFIVMVIIYLLRYKKLNAKFMFGGLFLFGLVVLPIVLYVAVNMFNWQSIDLGLFSIPHLPGDARFKQVSIFFVEGNQSSGLSSNFKLLVDLLVTQKDRWIWNAIPQFGEIYLFSMPLVLAGLIVFVMQKIKKSDNGSIVMLFWLIAAVLLGLVMPVNVNHMNIIFIPLIYFMAKGFSFILDQSRLMAGVLLALYLVWFGLFSRAYFTTFSEQIGVIFYESLDEAINFATENYDETITLTTNELHMPFVHVLYRQMIDPNEFLSTVIYYDPDVAYRDVASFGRYRFMDADTMPKDEGAYIVENREVDYFDQESYKIQKFKYYSVLIPLK